MANFIETLDNWRAVVMVFHLIGLALGVGGATVSDFLFFRFIKKLKISDEEADTLNSISKLIWVGMIILIISGIGLYLPNTERLNQSSKFLTKLVVVSVVFINGIALNTLVGPKLQEISFEKEHGIVSGELRRLRKTAFALGAISATSWYSALILGTMRSIPLSFYQAVSLYMFLLAIVVSLSQAAEYALSIKPKG